MAGIDTFLDVLLKLFGDGTASKAILVGAVIYSLLKIAKEVGKYYRNKWEMEQEKEQQMKDILEQVRKYPEWHEQSIGIQNHFNQSISSLENKLDRVSDSVSELRLSNDEEMAMTWRYRILRFNDEIMHDEKHTKEHFDQIMEDITKYENYCKEHPSFPNNKAVFAINNIKRIYQKCTDEGTFL